MEDHLPGSAGAEVFSQARLGKAPNEVSLTYAMEPLLAAEFELFDAFLRIDLAHTVMLGEQKILTAEQASSILRALAECRAAGPRAFDLDPKAGSFLLQVERYLSSRIGHDTAGRMHTGRSRNDQSAAVNRLYARDVLLAVAEAVARLQASVLALADRHVETYMPGFTHLQHAQPTTFGHYLMRHYYTVERDQQRLEGAFARTNLSALGGSAMVGTTWPVDRDRVAQLLGHDALVVNATDCGIFTRDYPAENAAVLSILVNNAGRLAGDLYLWSTWEFGMVEIDDALAGTSSIMPQKKNPHSLERIRGLAGLSIGWLPSVLGTLRSSSSSDLDLHFSPDPVARMGRDTLGAVELLRVSLETLRVSEEVMASRAGVYWTTASNLADTIVKECDLSFRIAHGVVGRLVRNCVEAGVGPEAVTAAMLDRAAEETLGRPLGIADETVQASLDFRSYIESLQSIGSAKPAEVSRSIAEERRRQEEHGAWLAQRQEQLRVAERELTSSVERLMGEAG